MASGGEAVGHERRGASSGQVAEGVRIVRHRCCAVCRCPAKAGMRRAVSGDGRSIAVVDAPSNLGLRPPGAGKVPGVYWLASSLRSRGIVSRLGALDGGGATPPPYTPNLDPETAVLNGKAVRELSVELAAKIDAVLEDGHFRSE